MVWWGVPKRLVSAALVLWLATAVADGAIYWWIYTDVHSPSVLPGWGIGVSLAGFLCAVAALAAALVGTVAARRCGEPSLPFVLLAALSVALAGASAAAGAWLLVVHSFALAS